MTKWKPFDAHGHNAAHWTPPAGGIADRARRAMMERADQGDIEARTERSQSFWSAFRQARSMKAPPSEKPRTTVKAEEPAV
jgi:hypothetical protein